MANERRFEAVRARSILSALALSAISWACGGSSSTLFPDSGTGGSAAGAGGSTTTGGSAQTGGTGGSDIDGGPAGCVSDADCPTGNQCDRATATCVPIQPQGCTSSADCASRTDGKNRCDVGSGACVECVASIDCGVGRVCTNNACAAGQTCSNSLDCPQGQVCNTTAQLCVACVIDADCGSGAHCAANTCRPLCDSDKDCTPLRLLCNTNLGFCVSCLDDAGCKTEEYCSQGACLPDVCVGGSSDCVNNAVVTCNTQGSATLPPVTCASNQTCVEASAAASCVDQVCSPLVKGCSQSGEQVVQCADDGLSQSTLQDCGALGQVCVAATCKPVVCSAGNKFCSGSEVRQCSAKGDTSTLVATCSSSQYCDAASVSCKNQVCTPNAPACNNAIATTCNANGSGYLTGGVDCATSGQVCVSGGCQDLICTPSARYCNGTQVRQCSSDGLSDSLVQTCTSAQYCDATSATCKATVCTPNQPACNSSVATTCNANGSGYLTGGVDCATTGQACVSGGCQDYLCTPSAKYCKANQVRQCSADGLSDSLFQTCTSTQYCDTASATCKAMVCTPNEAACDVNVATTCNATGTGYTGSRTDCTTTSQSCLAGTCVDTPVSCAAILATGKSTGDGVYFINPTGTAAIDVYCDMTDGGVTYEELAFGQHDITYAGYTGLTATDLQNVRVQQAFIWSYNKQAGMKNLAVGYVSNNCCFKGPDGITITLGTSVNVYHYMYPADPTGTTYHCNGAGYTATTMRFWVDTVAALSGPSLAANYFQYGVSTTTSCSRDKNPAFFFKRY